MARAKVRVNATPASARRKASADITRRKAKQKRASTLKRRAVGIGAVLLVSYVGFGGWWLHANGKIDKAMQVTHDAFWGATARAGFAVSQVTLEGREHVPLAVMKEALALEKGDPILALSVDAVRKRLLALPEVRSAQISRVLPSEVHVVIEERQPIALWQHAGKYAVVDRDGVVLNREIPKGSAGMLLVVGDDAPEHMKALIALLESAPALRSEVESAVRVGERRWNIRLKQGMTIMLPEEAADVAWQKFMVMAQKDALLQKAIVSVDLRLEDRVSVTPQTDTNSVKILTSARDT